MKIANSNVTAMSALSTRITFLLLFQNQLLYDSVQQIIIDTIDYY